MQRYFTAEAQRPLRKDFLKLGVFRVSAVKLRWNCRRQSEVAFSPETHRVLRKNFSKLRALRVSAVKLAETSNQVLMLFLRNTAIAILVLCIIGIGTAPAAEPGRERVLIGVSSKSIGFFDPWVAHEKGFFRKYGIDSEVITIRPNLSVVALHAGEIDYSWMTGTVIRRRLRVFRSSSLLSGSSHLFTR